MPPPSLPRSTFQCHLDHESFPDVWNEIPGIEGEKWGLYGATGIQERCIAGGQQVGCPSWVILTRSRECQWGNGGRGLVWSPRLGPLLGLSSGETHGKRWDGGAVGKFKRRLIFDARLFPHSMGVTPLSPSNPKLRPWIQSPINRNLRTFSYC